MSDHTIGRLGDYVVTLTRFGEGAEIVIQDSTYRYVNIPVAQVADLIHLLREARDLADAREGARQ